MGDRYRLRGAAAFVAVCLAGVRARRNYLALPLPAKRPAGNAGHVSIVIPARNEARRLHALLDSLSRLDYPDLDVTVVDDASEDGTAAIAEEAGVRVLRTSGPAPGWTGKSFACWMGVQSSRGEWILFTDADTVHGPHSLQASLATAQESRAGLVSLLAAQHCQTFWERLLLPYFYFLYFVGASRINRPRGNPLANGQYMLFHRRAYERIGGHEAVRGSIIEDVSLARAAARSGVPVVLARGEEHLSVRMYDGLPSLWEGFGKNAFRFVAVSPRTGIPTALAGIACGAVILEAIHSKSTLMRTALLLAPTVSLVGWERRFGVSPAYALLYPLAVTVSQVITLNSIRCSVSKGRTTWKGRSY